LRAHRPARRHVAGGAHRPGTGRAHARHRIRAGARRRKGDTGMKSVFAVIGLGTMGRNLALNIEQHGFAAAVWNLETDWTDAFLREQPGKKFTGAKTLDE